MLSNLFRRFRKLTNIRKMSGDDVSDSLLDSHEILENYINKRSKEDELDISGYLENLKYSSVEDFPIGLEWFNVSEPLSFAKHLKGKVVLLDFFTYCCINCMHILPTLKEIENEFSVEDGLVVIGVHSAKFDNEKLSNNILAAVQRYNISHPVVNDHDNFMWKSCGVCCWPTLILVGPHGNPIVLLMGEGHVQHLHRYIRSTIKHYKLKNEISNHKLPFESAFHLLPNLKGPLLFPGKITSYIESNLNVEFLGISDTGNNRILIVKNDGSVVAKVGGSRCGFKDGSLEEAQFNAPQGLVFQNEHTLYVADTENHAIRKIDLKKNVVTTVAGTGEQGEDYKGGKSGISQQISSPWDVCIFKTCNSNESNDGSTVDVLLIALAGTHQIWALFLEDTVWWKNQRYTAGTCICIAGSGREENRNNQYPHAAAFAQPSGLSLSMKSKEVYIADSESSSVRKMSLVDGKVSAVVGGESNPNNLFAFGDKDGKKYEAKLQHLLGLAMSKDENSLFVADTYNHKLKVVNVVTNTITTLTMVHKFNEPGGLCVSANGKKLYVADTNNHTIKLLELENDYSIADTKNFDIKFDTTPTTSKIDKSKLEKVLIKPLRVSDQGGKLILTTSLDFSDGITLTTDAPQNWFIELPNDSWSCVPHCGSDVENVDIVVTVPPKEIDNVSLDVIYKFVTCTAGLCTPKSFLIQVPIVYSKDASFTANVSAKIVMTPSKLQMSSL